MRFGPIRGDCGVSQGLASSPDPKSMKVLWSIIRSPASLTDQTAQDIEPHDCEKVFLFLKDSQPLSTEYQVLSSNSESSFQCFRTWANPAEAEVAKDLFLFV